MSGPVYALNLFDIADREEYLAYSRRSVEEVARHGGRVVALGRLLDSVAGDFEGRQVLILVATCPIRRWPTCTAIGSAEPRAMSGSCSIGWTISGRC